jgi:Cu+-exporting ATPase
MALDPVCNMEVDPGSSEWVSEHRGLKYYFCEPECKALFDKDPEVWASGGMTTYLAGGCSCCGGH